MIRLNKVVLAIVKVTSGEGDNERHEVQTWAYDAGSNEWTRLNPATEPESGGNRRRNLIFAPELNLAILENCTGQPREQQIWTYRYADTESPVRTADGSATRVPSDRREPGHLGAGNEPSGGVLEDAVRCEHRLGYYIERAVVEVWSEDQLPRLKENTLPLPNPSVGAIRRIGRFERLTDKPVDALRFTDSTIDLSSPAGHRRRTDIRQPDVR